jgi:hypothetical protein
MASEQGISVDLEKGPDPNLGSDGVDGIENIVLPERKEEKNPSSATRNLEYDQTVAAFKELLPLVLPSRPAGLPVLTYLHRINVMNARFALYKDYIRLHGNGETRFGDEDDRILQEHLSRYC